MYDTGYRWTMVGIDSYCWFLLVIVGHYYIDNGFGYCLRSPTYLFLHVKKAGI